MNPQYLPPQNLGGPQQGFPTNRSSPSLMSQPGQNFQSVPLGPSNPGQVGTPHMMPGMPPMTSAAGPLPPQVGAGISRNQIPPTQLPPSIGQNNQDQSNNLFSQPPVKQDLQQNAHQNETKVQYQNGHSQFQNRPSDGQQHEQTSLGGTTQNMPVGPPIPASYGQPSVSQPLSNPHNHLPPQATQRLPNQFGPGTTPTNQYNQFGGPTGTSKPPPIGQSAPQLNQLGGQVGPASNQMPTVSQMGPSANPINPPSSKTIGPPANHMHPPSNQMVPPNNQQVNPSSNQMGPPPTQQGQQPLFQAGQNPLGPPANFMGGPPNQMSQAPRPLQNVNQPPIQAQGRPNIPHQQGQNSYQFGAASQIPPPTGQPSFPTSQLSNQMQNLNLNNQRQYPGGPQKNLMNGGEPGPHMPSPLNQQAYINGQQMRAPPGPGYPPLPGQPPMPGQPAMPGQPPMPGMHGPGQMPGPPSMVPPGNYPQPNYQQQQQQNRRLDPDQMPSPIQVTQDDQQNRSGVFVTNQKGLVPPLVTTNFVVQDQGNASPRFIRSTMYNVPITQDIIKQTAVPFSLVISPMARQADQEYPPPIVNFGELGPVRCVRCKAYMCPFMQFIDSGRRFQCLFCKATTDVPTEYFQHLDHTGQRMDRYERPELVLGTYEFVATADYCRNNTLPKPPAIIFLIDVSYNNIKSGLVHLLCSQMKEIIQNLPVDQGHEKSNMKVGFITYNSSVHFYNIKGSLGAPQMLVVGDVHEMFMPLLDGFLCTPEESGPVIDSLMEQIPAMFSDTRETETILLPAIQAGLEALKASECAGKLLVFHSTLPSAEAPGKLKNRDDRKLLGTEKEKTVLTPQNQAYNQLGQDCAGAGCSVDLFIFNNAYIDLATIGQVARLTGGEIFKYTYFQADLDGERLINDVIIDISRPIAFDAIMRVRTSTGVRPTDFYGHFFMSNTTDMELAAIDSDKAVAVEIKHDDKLQEEEGVYIQVALLYTSCSGQRRLRIINLSLKTCSQMADLYRSCDLDTMINYFSKQATYKLLDNNPKALKDSIVHRAAQILATYRKNCASPSSAGQLILPECMKLLPLYVNCLLKSDALSGGSDMTVDDRSFVMQAVMTMDILTSLNYFYPRLIPIHDLDTSKEITVATIPAPIRTSFEKISEQGIYILENGIHMFLWFGLGVSPDIIQKLFGAPSAIQVDIERQLLPELDNPYSLAVRSLIEEIRIQRHRYMRVTIVRQREKLEPVFKHFLVEDQGTDASPSYVDFLCHLHKEIRTLLS